MILITGINGFVGSHTAVELVRRGEKVRGLVRKTSDLKNLAPILDKIELCEGDITNKSTLIQAFKGVDICIHCAALVKIGKNPRNEYFSTNLNGTINVCELADEFGLKKLIHISSCETMRNPPSSPFTRGGPETLSPPLKKGGQGGFINESITNSYSDMLGDYGRSKFLADQHVIKFAETSHCRATILNPTAVIGPGDINYTAPGYFISLYVRRRVPAYFETGFNIIDVRDLAVAIANASTIQDPSLRYVLGGTNVMLKDLFRLLRKVSNKRIFSLRLPKGPVIKLCGIFGKRSELFKVIRASELPFFFDSNLAKNELSFSPRYELRETLKDALDWYKKEDYL